ncbi:MAG: hypothetical protein ACR2LN_01095 [Candidatus Levyibacteriota bacterium]
MSNQKQSNTDLHEVKKNAEKVYKEIGLPEDFGISLKDVPHHLTDFWFQYSVMLRNGFFDRLDKNFAANKDKLPDPIIDYARKLIALMKKETKGNLQKKYDYFQALMKLIDYLGGELGR